MASPSIVRYRPRRANVAVAYSTKDRVDLTRSTAAQLIDDPALDLYWFDGSATEAGRQVARDLCAKGAAVCELHQGVVGGPDCAIMYALQVLREQSHDLVILVENDVLLSSGWFDAMWASINQAQAAGFNVGAATVRVFDRRVLSFNGTYCLMLNSGAGFIALTPAAIGIVLAHYRTLDGAEFIRHFQALTGKDISATVEFGASQRLSVDFIFDVMLYLHGYVVCAPPVTFVRMIDGILVPSVTPVTGADQHLPAVRSLITRPEQIRVIDPASARFQKSPHSDRLLIGCHQLQLRVNVSEADCPVVLEGKWSRIWLQGLGPFGLTGAGIINVAVQAPPIGILVVSGDAGSELRLSREDGSLLWTGALPPRVIADILLSEAGAEIQRAILRVVSGSICMIGLTVDKTVVTRYASDHPSVDHLPTLHDTYCFVPEAAAETAASASDGI